MTEFKYLIIGGGMTAASAVSGIREKDSVGSVGLISAEQTVPYDRPPLSKSLWKGEALDSIWRGKQDTDVQLYLGRVIERVIPRERLVVGDQGDIFRYEKLLLATGARPRHLSFGDGEVIYFRTFVDYQHLRALVDTGRRFAVIGGGFIGAEIAAALALNGMKVVMVFPGNEIGGRLFPSSLASYITEYYRQKGIKVLTGTSVIGMEIRGEQRVLRTSIGHEIAVDGVVAGIGIEPNIELARTAGLRVGDGIIVDDYLRTSDPTIYAAGDVASFHSPSLERRIRVEHEDNANQSGRLAGRNMAGSSEVYHHLPSFYSDMFELGYEAVGELDSHLETIADWKTPNEEGVIYYLWEGRVRGVLLWNVWGKVDAARQLIAEPGPFSGEDLKGRLN